MTTTVVVADDHPLMREAVARALADDENLQVLEQADGVGSVLEAVRRLTPEVAVIDLRLGDGDAFDVLRAAAAENLPTRFLVVSSFGEPALVHRALETGAAGYLTKGTEAASLRGAVLEVAAGSTVVDPTLQAAVFAQIGRRETRSEPRSALSERELVAVRLAAAGKKEREIAGELMLSTSSVKSYLRRAYDKLGATDRASAVAEAVRRGLVE